MLVFPRAHALGVLLRVADTNDAPILRRVFSSTREADLIATGLTAAMMDQLINIQFRAQNMQFEATYPALQQLAVVRDDTPIGRLFLDEAEDRVTLVDIALLTEMRGKGIGTAILGDVTEWAAGRRIELHVARDNPARRLYLRAGFITRDEGPVYDRMEYRAIPSFGEANPC